MSHAIPANLVTFDRAKKVSESQVLLAAHYGWPSPPRLTSRPDPLVRLVRAIVAQNTSRPNQDKALDRLQRRFPDVALVADAPLVDIIDCIYVAGLANVKAPRLQELIRVLLERTNGTLDLNFLYDWPLDRARTFLVTLPGVGPLSASLVLLFGMGRAVLPVNTGLHRVAQRVGMIPPAMKAERAQDVLQAMIADEDIYAFHVNTVTLAREFCRANHPRCEICPLAPVCDWAHGGYNPGPPE